MKKHALKTIFALAAMSTRLLAQDNLEFKSYIIESEPEEYNAKRFLAKARKQKDTIAEAKVFEETNKEDSNAKPPKITITPSIYKPDDINFPKHLNEAEKLAFIEAINLPAIRPELASKFYSQSTLAAIAIADKETPPTETSARARKWLSAIDKISLYATINIKTNKNKEDAKLFLFKIHKKDKKTTLKAVRIITEKNSHRIEAENIECSQESNNDMIRALGFILLSGEEFKLKTKIEDNKQ